MNRLASETSPYLLQHAHNPVDWYPWGPEAFQEARRRDVPIFLSIGYSTCYWCHVMERESFENQDIARLMNEHFVNIKLDREERPDIDDLYMAATQILSGRGGWPMSCFLEPQGLRPFWCGTYFPPEPRHGMPSFPQLLNAMSDTWRTRRDQAVEQAAEVADHVASHAAAAEAPVALGLPLIGEAARTLLGMLDRVHGGFGSAPKFPQPVYLELLLDVRENAGDDATRSAIDHAVRLTLDAMATGGIFDQVGGGFHRYSVDDRWLVPHFEKMLYDNAQLASLYARAGRTYGDSFYLRTARRTLEYVLREMTLAPQPGATGPFFSAQDAEVDGREGLNYLWQPEEIREHLSPEDAEFAIKVYGLDGPPNFRDPHHPGEPPAYILRLAGRPESLASAMKLDPDAFLARLDALNAALLAARAARKQPRLDDKVLTSWNGLMIAAFARAGAAMNEPRYLSAAAHAADFILAGMRDSDTGDLLRSYRGGRAKTPAFLEDYAFLIQGLLALHAADPAASIRRDQASALADQADAYFGDPATGGYFDTRERQSDLFVRARTTHDGATPSGASVMLHNLIDLHQATGEPATLERALAAAGALSAAIARSPISATNAVRGAFRLIMAGQGDRLADLGPEAATQESGGAAFTPVEIYATTERVEVGKDRPAQLQLVLRIAEGYHITAADPGPGGRGLAPLRVSVINGAGVAAYADYPPGEPYGDRGDIRIHKGELEFTVALERTGEWSGRPLLSLTCQACTDTECLPPTVAELDVAIDRLD